jgi:MFS family permease
VHLNRNLILIYGAAFLRACGVGLTGVILGIYLARAGFHATFIGVAVAVGFGGAALATLGVSYYADRFGRRRTLLVLALLGALGGGVALVTSQPLVLLIALVGMINGMGRDRSAASALEQAIVPGAISDDRRTMAMAWYNLVLDAGHAMGALVGLTPYLLRRWFDVNILASYQLTFIFIAGANLLGAIFYLFLSPQVEVAGGAARTGIAARVSPQSKKIVWRLAALFSLDGLGGGFLTGTLIAYWFFRRFGVSEATLGPLFFSVRLVNAGSYFIAAWLSRRIGLLNTMVFTHIPSSLFLMGVALAPSFGWAVALFLAREFLVEMDVPTRQSYTVAVVRPEERTYASGFTGLTRSVTWGAGSTFSGFVMQHLALATPLFLGGGLKIIYDLLLFGAFRRVKPPEEQVASAPSTASSEKPESKG